MFKHAYQKDNQEIRPEPETLARVKRKMRAESEGLPMTPTRKTGTGQRRRLRRLAAAAACLAVVLLSVRFFNLTNFRPLPKHLIAAAESYDQIYEVIRTLQKPEKEAWSFGDLLAGLFRPALKNDSAEKVLYAPSSESADMDVNVPNGEGSRNPEYSDTNLQVAGVQEADIVKTDGRYIYAVSGSYIYIAAADDGNLTIVSRLERTKTHAGEKQNERSVAAAFELYITDNRLILLEKETTYTDEAGKDAYDDAWRGPLDGSAHVSGGRQSVCAEIYDMTDRTNPVLMKRLGQSGRYLSSRMVGDILYVTTVHSVNRDIKKSDPATYTPYLYTDAREQTALAAADITIVPNPKTSSYIVVTGADTQKPENHISSKAVLGSGKNLYANADMMVIAVSASSETDGVVSANTTLLKFTMDRGFVSFAASGTVPGTVLNQFSMDVYNGCFRIVTTEDRYRIYNDSNSAVDSAMQSETGRINHLYVLDEQMRVVGKIEDVAPGERVYSVRFDGKIGYFVTFRQVDPLFAVDLKDPQSPQILSALKIPGFSEYLHPYGQGLLLGIGKDADPNTGAVGGMKLSMFDVSDPADVSEIHTYLLGMQYSWSEASYNHKAILVNQSKNLIAFAANGTYLIFGYDPETGFVKRAELDLTETGGYPYYESVRGLFIEEAFYVITAQEIRSYSLDSFAKISGIMLN